jgi:hypothetical protein
MILHKYAKRRRHERHDIKQENCVFLINSLFTKNCVFSSTKLHGNYSHVPEASDFVFR